MRSAPLFCLDLFLLSNGAILLGMLPRTHEGEVFNYPEYFLMFSCLSSLLFRKCSQQSESIMKMNLEIKAELLSYAQMAVIIIQTFLGDSQKVCCFGKAHLPSFILRICEGLMQVAPLPDELNCLAYRPFLAAALTRTPDALGLFFRVVSNKKKIRVQKGPIDYAGPILEGKEGIGRRVIDLHPADAFRAMLEQKWVKIDRWR